MRVGPAGAQAGALAEAGQDLVAAGFFRGEADPATAVQQLVAEGATGSSSLADFVARLSAPGRPAPHIVQNRTEGRFSALQRVQRTVPPAATGDGAPWVVTSGVAAAVEKGAGTVGRGPVSRSFCPQSRQ